MTEENSLEQKIFDAYRRWVETGKLTNDDAIVHLMHEKFKKIAHETVGICEYSIICSHATGEMFKLADIMKARSERK